jgi:hypothetical protein
MFFLLRTAFWLTIALALLPTGQQAQTAQGPKVDPVDALTAAGSAVADMSTFCDRQAQACEIGAQTAVAIGQRAQAGAKMVYEFINERVVAGDGGPLPQPRPAALRTGDAPAIAAPATMPATTASVRRPDGSVVPIMLPVPVPRVGSGTLTASDREPAWRSPAPAREAKPREARQRPA